MKNEQVVLIVGAGPCGLFAACELARHGIRCRIVEKELGISTKSRAIAIQARTLEIFQIANVNVQEFLRSGHPVQHGRIFDRSGDLLAQIDFDHLQTKYPFMLLLPQNETEAILERRLNAYGLCVERGTELVAGEQSSSEVTARLRRADGTIATAEFSWVIGCDGAHSSVRHLLGFSFEGASYEDAFMLADAYVDGDLDTSAFQVFTAADGPLAFFPLLDGRYRIVGDNPPKAWSDEPSLEQCQALVDERGPGGIKLHSPRWLAKFHLHHRRVRQLRRGRVFLAGDAAHIHSPAGGQGMNTGLQDVFNLAWKLALVMRGFADAKLLETYDAERLPIDEMVIRNSDRLTRLVTLKNPLARYLRDHLVPIVSSFGRIRQRAGQAVSELAIAYQKSAICEDDGAPGSSVGAGERGPDVFVQQEDGLRRSLYHCLSSGHAIALVSAQEAESALADQILKAPHPPWIRTARVADPEAPFGCSSVHLVRPDGYVGLRCELKECPEQLRRYLAQFAGRNTKPAIFEREKQNEVAT
jgi:2-polyprenyl-6-methoxyphenol hydroxylase-like FAD-dependent oxidoreductase